jgi:hypothetical protein
MSPKGVIISAFGSDIMLIPKTLEEVMEDVGSCRNEDIDQPHLDHIADHSAHAARDHRSGEAEEDDAFRVIEHLPEDLKTFINIPALKRGVLKGLDQIEEGLDPLEIQMSNRFPKNA